MKNYNEMADSVFKRSSNILKKKNERRKQMRLLASTISCFCLVALVITGVASSNLIPQLKPETPPTISSTVITEVASSNLIPQLKPETPPTISSTNDTHNNNNGSETSAMLEIDKALSPDDPRIIWGNGVTGDNALSEWNGKRIDINLLEAFNNNPEGSIYAIAMQVVFNANDNFLSYKYNGKTVTEYKAEFEKEQELPNILIQLLKLGGDLKYGEELYKTEGINGSKWTKELYDETVAYFGEELLQKYIVNGEFLRDKLEYDLSQPIPHSAEREYYAALRAYESYVLEQTEKHLISKKIMYERKTSVFYKYEPIYANLDSFDYDNKNVYNKIENSRQYLIVYVSKDEFTSFAPVDTSNLHFGLADKNARDGIWPFDPIDS